MATKNAPVAMVSIKPTDFINAGLINDVDVEVMKARVGLFSYPGRDDLEPQLSVNMDVKNLETEELTEINLTAGNGFTASEDGIGFVPTGSRSALAKDSNFFLWIASLCDEGFPIDKIGNDVTLFEGLQFHLLRKPAPKSRNMGEGKGEVILVDKIVKLPWDKAGKAPAKAAGGGSSKATPAASKAASNGGGGTEDRAKEILTELAAQEKDGFPFAKIRNLGFKALKNEPDIRTKVLEHLTDQTFVEAACEELKLNFDGETIAA